VSFAVRGTWDARRKLLASREKGGRFLLGTPEGSGRKKKPAKERDSTPSDLPANHPRPKKESKRSRHSYGARVEGEGNRPKTIQGRGKEDAG